MSRRDLWLLGFAFHLCLAVICECFQFSRVTKYWWRPRWHHHQLHQEPPCNAGMEKNMKKMHENESHDHHMRICQTFDNAVWLAVTGSATPMARKHYAFGACDTGSCAHQGGGHGRVPGSGAVNPWVKTVSIVAKMEAQVIDLRASEIWCKVPVKMKVPPQASAHWKRARGGPYGTTVQASLQDVRNKLIAAGSVNACCYAAVHVSWQNDVKCKISKAFGSMVETSLGRSWNIIRCFGIF